MPRAFASMRSLSGICHVVAFSAVNTALTFEINVESPSDPCCLNLRKFFCASSLPLCAVAPRHLRCSFVLSRIARALQNDLSLRAVPHGSVGGAPGSELGEAGSTPVEAPNVSVLLAVVGAVLELCTLHAVSICKTARFALARSQLLVRSACRLRFQHWAMTRLSTLAAVGALCALLSVHAALAATYRPVVLMHGLTDSKEGMAQAERWIRQVRAEFNMMASNSARGFALKPGHQAL